MYPSLSVFCRRFLHPLLPVPGQSRVLLLLISLASAELAFSGENKNILPEAHCPNNAGQQNCCAYPPRPDPLKPLPPDKKTLIDAGKTRFSPDRSVYFKNGVRVRHKNILLQADEIILSKSDKQYIADHATVRFGDGWQAQGEQIKVAEDGKTGQVTSLNFELFDQKISGKAEKLLFSKEFMSFDKGNFTQCPPQQKSWFIKFDQLELHRETDTGIVRNFKLYVFKVPVIYIPWISFPLSKKGKSGLLVPSLSYSASDGIKYGQSYYWKLAPNYDLTLGVDYFSKRGAILQTEYRHLTPNSRWQLTVAALDRDARIQDQINDSNGADTEAQGNRWLYQVIQNSNFKNVETGIDYTEVSDRLYEHDLDPKTDHIHEDYLKQEIDQRIKFGDFSIGYGLSRYQALRDYIDRYQQKPWFEARLRDREVSGRFNPRLKFFYSEYDHSSSTVTTGKQQYVEIGAVYPIDFRYGKLEYWLKLRNLKLQIDGGDEDNTTAFSTGLSGSLYLSRSISSRWHQTLEPRFYYVYTQNRQQDLPVNFDSRSLELTVWQLFRDSRFSGHDRIDDANRLSLAVSSRIFDTEKNRPLLELTIGQILFFADREVTLANGSSAYDVIAANDKYSPVLINASFFPTSQMQLTSELQWDTRSNSLKNSYSQFRFKTDNDFLLDISYRGAAAGILNDDEQEQWLLKTDFPLNPSWQLFGKWYYDQNSQASLEQEAGFRYISCCWSVSVAITRDRDRFGETDTTIKLNFSLKGHNTRNLAHAL